MREKIETTEAKARELAPMIEKMITKAKGASAAAHRDLSSSLPKDAAGKLMKTIAPRLKDRRGGYTRITRVGPRERDASPQALIEILSS